MAVTPPMSSVRGQDLVGVAGEVMAALESLRPAFELPADMQAEPSPATPV